MNKEEIKKMFSVLTEQWGDTDNYINDLLCYSKELQQENEELKKNQRYYKNGVFSLEYDKETLSDMVDDYKSRIEKAVEYIKEHIQKYDIDGSIGDFDEFDMLTKPNYLLNILQNGSDEE